LLTSTFVEIKLKYSSILQKTKICFLLETGGV
jgi:hypothetical protein